MSNKNSPGENAFNLHLKALSLPEPEREYRFAAIFTGGIGKGCRERIHKAGLKDWRFDFAWPQYKLAVEIEGGVYSKGRHTRGKGYSEDCVKYNEAAIQGWMVIRFPTASVINGSAIDSTARAINARIEMGCVYV